MQFLSFPLSAMKTSGQYPTGEVWLFFEETIVGKRRHLQVLSIYSLYSRCALHLNIICIPALLYLLNRRLKYNKDRLHCEARNNELFILRRGVLSDCCRNFIN